MEAINKRYRILWIDDQFEELIDFNIQAENNGIDLDGYTSFEEGFNVLERDLAKYDGVLLDAMFFETKDQVQGTEDESGLGMAIAKLNELKSQKLIPWFVLSGKESFTKTNNSLLKANKKRCFDKTNGNDLEELLKSIKEEADEVEDTKIRHRYQRVFAVCTEEYIGQNSASHLLKILRSVDSTGAKIEDLLYFNRLRVILEDVFRAANKFGLLHDRCVSNGQVVLKNSFRFLTQEKVKISDDTQIYCLKKHMPVLVERAVQNILDITNVASHSESPDKEQSRLELMDFRQRVNSPYLLYSLTFQLIDIMLWFKNYVEENKNYSSNIALWKEERIPNDSAIHTGLITQDVNGNFYCGEYQLNYKYTEQNFKVGDRITILDATENGNFRTKDTYPYFANKYIRA